MRISPATIMHKRDGIIWMVYPQNNKQPKCDSLVIESFAPFRKILDYEKQQKPKRSFLEEEE